MFRLIDLVREHRRHRSESKISAPRIDLSDVPDEERPVLLAALEAAMVLSLEDQRTMITHLESTAAAESSNSDG